MVKKTHFWLGCFVALASLSANAIMLDTDITGLSYHVGAKASRPSLVSAPRKIDKYAAYVFNPGVGLGVDLRKDAKDPFWGGLSPFSKIVYLRDCADKGFYILIAGGKYRYMLGESFSLDGNFAITGVSSEKHILSRKRTYVLNPYFSVSANIHFKRSLLGITTSYIPRNTSAGDAITGFHILFFNITFSTPIF